MKKGIKNEKAIPSIKSNKIYYYIIHGYYWGNFADIRIEENDKQI